MRKLLLLSSVSVLASVSAFAQTKAPQSFNYQGALRNPNGTPLANTTVGLRLSILADTENGTSEYYEVRTVQTNALGLYSVKINSPGALSTSAAEGKPFDRIAWGAGDKYFKVEVDPSGGTGYIFAGSSPILATPYAIYAEKGGTSGYNTWASKPENAGKSADAYLDFLKGQAGGGQPINAKSLTSDNGGIDGLLTIENGTGAVLTEAVVKLDKSKFDQAARQAVADGFNGTATDPSVAALNTALDGANAGLIVDPNSKTAVALGTAATTPGNPLQVGIDQSVGGAAQDPNSNTTKGLVNGLVSADGTPGSNGPLQDAIAQTITNDLTASPVLAGSPAAALQEAVKQLVGSSADGTGTLKSDNDGTDADQILTIADGSKAAFHDATYTISKRALNKNTEAALTAADDTDGATALQNALAQANANTLNKDYATASPEQQAFQDAINANTSAALNPVDALGAPKAATPAQLEVQEAANQNAAKALNADPGTAGQKAFQDAISGLVSKSGKDFTTQNATGDGTEANILQIGATNTTLTAAKSVLAEIDLRVNKGALNKNTADALGATGTTDGASVLQEALAKANAAALNADPGTAGQQEFQQAINQNAADGINNALATPVTGGAGDVALAKAIQDAAGKATSGAAGVSASDAGTDAANILSVTEGATNSTFKNVQYTISKLALNNNTTEALTVPTAANGGVNLTTAVQNAAKAAATANVTATKDNTSTDVVSVVTNANSTFVPVVVNYSQEAADLATANAITGTNTSTNAAALKTAVESAAKSAVTADNGITNTAGNLQLGGALVQATTVTASATNTLAVGGLVDQSADPANYSQVLVQKVDGTLAYAAIAKIKPQVFSSEHKATTDEGAYIFTSSDAVGLSLNNFWVFKNGVRLPEGTYTYDAGKGSITITSTTGLDAVGNNQGVNIVTGDVIRIQFVK